MLTLGQRFNYPESSIKIAVDSIHPRRYKPLGLSQDNWNPLSKAQRTQTKSMQSITPIWTCLQLVHNFLSVKSTSFPSDFTIHIAATLHLPKGMTKILQNVTPIPPNHSWVDQPYRMTNSAHVRMRSTHKCQYRISCDTVMALWN